MNIDEFFGKLDEIKRQAREIRHIANALTTIGCDRAASTLFECTDVIADEIVVVKLMYSEDLSKQCQESKAMSGAILNALVSGSRLGSAVEVLPHTLGEKK